MFKKLFKSIDEILRDYVYMPTYALLVIILISIVFGFLNAATLYLDDATMKRQEIETRVIEGVNTELERLISVLKNDVEENEKKLKNGELIKVEPVRQSWRKVEDELPQAVVANSQGILFPTLPKTIGKTDKERMLFIRDSLQSPIDDAGIDALISYSKEVGMDAAAPFCIAFADSQLGTQGKGAKTKNPCNLGNTDGGGTLSFERYTDGLQACAAHLFSPAYKNVNKLGELSIGGRILLGEEAGSYATLAKDGKMWWASSNENHIINVVRCMREVKGQEDLDYNYNFK